MLDQLRHRQEHVLRVFLVTTGLCTRVLLFGLTSVSVIERFETGGIEGENEGLAKTTQRVYL